MMRLWCFCIRYSHVRFNKVKSRPQQAADANPVFFNRCILELGLEERNHISERSIGLVETEDSNLIVVSSAAITVH